MYKAKLDDKVEVINGDSSFHKMKGYVVEVYLNYAKVRVNDYGKVVCFYSDELARVEDYDV
jgi:hypothetical protein